MNRKFLQTICAYDFQIPSGYDLGDLTPDLVALLASPDAGLRDDLAYRILSVWVRRGVYSDDHLRGLAMQLVTQLSVGLGERRDRTVFGRSFAALLLADIVRYDHARAFLSRNEIENLLHWTLEYFGAEIDFRGYLVKHGWAHAIAHAADLLAALAAHRHLDAADLRDVLFALADKVTTPTPDILTHDEDERLAAVVVTAAARDEIDGAAFDAWLARCGAVMALASPEDAFDPAIFGAYQNTKRLLNSLYLQWTLANTQPAFCKQLLAALRKFHS